MYMKLLGDYLLRFNETMTGKQDGWTKLLRRPKAEVAMARAVNLAHLRKKKKPGLLSLFTWLPPGPFQGPEGPRWA
jgi:hypothetical protein